MPEKCQDGGGTYMKLMVCIVDNKYGSRLVHSLSDKGYRVTKLASTGGFLKKGNDTLLIGVRNDGIEHLQQELKEIIQHIEKEKKWVANQNRYTSFVVNSPGFLSKLGNNEGTL